jgi:hypothetical protein
LLQKPEELFSIDVLHSGDGNLGERLESEQRKDRLIRKNAVTCACAALVADFNTADVSVSLS